MKRTKFAFRVPFRIVHRYDPKKTYAEGYVFVRAITAKHAKTNAESQIREMLRHNQAYMSWAPEIVESRTAPEGERGKGSGSLPTAEKSPNT